MTHRKHLTTTLTLFLLFFCTSLMAQELSVKGFREATTDLAARTQARQDLNGNDCALVKVQIAASGVTFSGIIMGDVANEGNEYWVYMPEGTKRLTIRHPSYLPLEVTFADYGISALHGKTTYVLTLLLGEIPQGVQQPKVQTGWIILDSKPQGASVFINDQFVGNTPLNNYKQAYGTYSYRLELPNYHASTGVIELNSARLEKTVTLLPAFGAVSITSNVTGAKVIFDGKDTGKTTPCTIQEVASGQHTVSVQMEKYAPQQQSVVVEDGKTAQVNATLSARFARVTIRSTNGAEIYSNGVRVGTTQYSDDMMEGFYDVEVRLAHHRSVTRQVQVVAGQPQELTLNPIPIYGSVDIVSTPHDADVEIDGKAYGKTPMTVEQLLEGNHQVTVSKTGYIKETVSVSITDKETATVNISLKDMPKYFTRCPDDNHPHLIDLGLPSGTKWACCNVDASKPEDYGGYYAWGETTTKSDYSWSTYKHCDGSSSSCHDLGSSICGTQYDVAHVKWGGPWQLSTLDQIKELLDKCNKGVWTTQNGVEGRKFTGPNGGSIFLPAAGYRNGTDLDSHGTHGDCLSGTQDSEREGGAYGLGFSSVGAGWGGAYRYYGQSVRPVAR